MAGVFLIIFVNAVRRYTTGKSFVWGEELPVYLAVYGIVFGLTVAHLQSRHIRFNFLTDRLAPRLREALGLFIEVCVAVIGATLAYSGWLTMAKRGGVEASSLVRIARDAAEMFGIAQIQALGHMSAWLFAISLGGALLAIAATLNIAHRLRDGKP